MANLLTHFSILLFLCFITTVVSKLPANRGAEIDKPEVLRHINKRQATPAPANATANSTAAHGNTTAGNHSAANSTTHAAGNSSTTPAATNATAATLPATTPAPTVAPTAAPAAAAATVAPTAAPVVATAAPAAAHGGDGAPTTTRNPSIVVNIDIDIGQTSSNTTTSPNITTAGPSTSLPTIAAASAINLAGNGTQVICFSLPFDLIQRLVPLIRSLTDPSSSTPAPAPPPVNVLNSTLFNPLVPITAAPVPMPQQPVPPHTGGTGDPGLLPIPSRGAVTDSPNYPFLGPYGVGSYGGFRPEPVTQAPVYRAPPPQPAPAPYARPSNPYPSIPGASGVIPYYTYPPTPAAPAYYTNPAPAYAPTTRPPVQAYGSYGQPSSGYGGSPAARPSSSSYGGNSGSSVVGMPGYAFSGASADGLQPVVVQPESLPVAVPPRSASRPNAAVPLLRPPAARRTNAIPLLRQLQVPTTEAERAKAALCGPQRDLVPDAITVTRDGVMHIFTGKQVFGLRDLNNGKYSPMTMGSISAKWPGVAVSVTSVYAATTRQDGTTFLFSGDSYWKFDDNNRMAAEFPKKTSIGFPGIPGIDSVYQAPLSDGDMNFLQGNQFYTYNHRRFPPFRGPLPASNNLGIPASVRKINAAYTDWKSQDVTLVSGNQMYRLSRGQVVSGYPQAFSSLFDC